MSKTNFSWMKNEWPTKKKNMTYCRKLNVIFKELKNQDFFYKKTRKTLSKTPALDYLERIEIVLMSEGHC